MKKWLFLAAAIGFEVTATLALRAANDHLGWLALVVVGYPVSFALLAMLLREGMSIGVAYGVWSASGVALTALLAVPLFGDQLTLVMGLGFVVIVAGVLLVQLGSHGADAPGRQHDPHPSSGTSR